MPTDVKKYIIAVAPHTSNWDFPVGLAARSVLRIQSAQFLGKSQLFVPPFGWIFRMLGGHPVDRSSSHDMVEQVVKIFAKHENFILAMAPEGTRKKVTKLRTGFYFIAKGAQVPIVPVGFARFIIPKTTGRVGPKAPISPNFFTISYGKCARWAQSSM